ncbi:MAG: hypothetical protein IRY94_15040 [Rhodospirillaceae bacterium]|nr:hypothetical protein [Rhodospirillaceae bacterium]
MHVLLKRAVPDWLRRRELLAVTIVGFVLALAIGLVLLFREVRTNQYAMRNGTWIAVQIEIEFQRFLKALALYGLNDPDVSYRDLVRRLDILWSRLLLTQQGPATRGLRSDPEFMEVVGDLDRALSKVDPFVQELSPGDSHAYHSIETVLHPFEQRLHVLVQHLIMESDTLARERQLRIRYWQIIAAFLGVVATGAAGIVMLVRERRRSERLAKAEGEARRQAEDASRAKSSFLAMVSHELRTPLNAIIGFSEMMTNAMFGPLGHPRYVEYAEVIRRSGTHLLEVINGILDISRIESGSVHIAPADIDLNRLALNCLTLIEPRAREQGVLVLRHLDPALPLVRSDERLLRQILLNLLSNAVKFTPERGRVELRTALGPHGGPVVEVADTGVGMAPEDVARAFQPFVQVGTESRRDGEGSGLGLSISKGFVEVLGATLSLASAPGAGTTATLALPAACVVAPPADATERAVA